MKKITVVIPSKKGIEIPALKSLDSSKVKIIIKEGVNPSINRNKGANQAKTPFVAFINTHTIVTKNWTEEIIKFFKKYPYIDIVGGPQIDYKNEKLFARSTSYALSSIFGSAAVNSRYNTGKLNLNADETMLTSANLICKKKVFNKVLFDNTIYPGEDPKFIEDAKKQGLKIAYSPDIQVHNLRRETISDLSKQIFNYGKFRPRKEGFFQTLRKIYFLIPSLFIIYLLSLPLTYFIKPIFIIPLLLYILLDLLFSLYESVKNRNIFSLILLLVIYPTIHISYGAGYIYGLFKK